MNYLSATWEFIKPSNVFKHKFTPQAKNLDVEGKKLLITGGSKGIGLNICIQLAQKGIAEICMLARNEKIMAEAIELIKQKSLKIRAEQGFGPLKIYAIRLDQADYASIRTAIDTLFTQNDGTYPNFDVVMLNAGVMMGGLDAKTGYNNCFQINHLGTFYFGTYLLNKIKETQNQYPKRLLISGSAGNLAADPNGIVFDDINLENPQHPRSSPHFLGQTFNFYIQSKLANLLHVRKLAQILDNQKIPITVHCIHPGCVESDIRGVRTDRNSLLVYLESWVLRSNHNGAQNHLHVGFCRDSKIDSKNGQYYDNLQIDTILKMKNMQQQMDDLWKFSEQVCDLKLSL